MRTASLRSDFTGSYKKKHVLLTTIESMSPVVFFSGPPCTTTRHSKVGGRRRVTVWCRTVRTFR